MGLLGVFEYIGAVPPVLVSGRRHRRGAPGLVGRDRGGGGVPEVRRASPDRGRVSAIRARATRRAARGNAVGFLRRNVMVPLPNAESHARLTRFMLSRCDRIAEDPHYRKGEPVRDLFARDREAMAPMPGCLWSNKAVRCRHLFWTVMAFILDSVGGRHRCDMRAPVPLVS